MNAAPTINTGPVFVLGHPRSGTTFLQLLLLTHPAFTSGPETHFFTYVMEPYASRIPLRWLGHNEPGPTADNPLETVFVRLAAKPGIVLDASSRDRVRRAVEPGMDPARLLDALMHELAEPGSNALSRSRRWIEKTPRHAYFVRDILECFPSARVVNLIRDPRSVVSSPRRFSMLAPDSSERRAYIEHRCASWERVLHAVQTAAAEDQDGRVRTIQYERLVHDVLGVMTPIYSWLGEDPAAADPERFSDGYDRVTTPEEEDRKGLTGQGRVVNRSSVWRERLTTAEAQLIESRCGDTMRALGYEPGPEIVDPAAR